MRVNWLRTLFAPKNRPLSDSRRGKRRPPASFRRERPR